MTSATVQPARASVDSRSVPPEQGRAELPRVLGLTSVMGILVGTVIGSGIFIVPAAIAGYVGSPLLLMAVWVVGGLLTFFGALAFSELGAAYPQAGGMYVYLREAFGKPTAFLFGWTLFLVIDSGAIATLSMAFASIYLPQFTGPISAFGTKAIAVTLIAALVGINYVGTLWGARVQNLLMFIKFAAVLSVSIGILALARGHAAGFVAPAPAPMSAALIGGFGLALQRALWAYKGWEAVSFSAGEIRNPERNLPIGLFAGTLVIIALYLAANLAYLYVLPFDQLIASKRVASDAVAAAGFDLGATILGIVILLSITGAANGNVLTAPRVFFAMARDGVFFERFGAVHPRYLTPHVSILATGLWAMVLSASGTFGQLADYVVFGQWIFFGLTVAAVIVLRRTRPDLPRPYRTWGYPITPILFVCAALFISANALINQFWNAMAGLLIIALGIPAYMFWTRGHRRITT
jgi:APA family basic amino acid/polyamine antiporter